MKQTAVITLGSGKQIRIEFFPEDAPKTVENFVTLAKKGFYDGLSFHRVVPDFVVQGGCPKGDGTGGPGYQIKAEFNKQKHVRGAVAMARSQHPDSAGSQFYITYGATPHLDNNYTVFGKVVSGMEEVDRIKQGDRMTSVAIEEACNGLVPADPRRYCHRRQRRPVPDRRRRGPRMVACSCLSRTRKISLGKQLPSWTLATAQSNC